MQRRLRESAAVQQQQGRRRWQPSVNSSSVHQNDGRVTQTLPAVKPSRRNEDKETKSEPHASAHGYEAREGLRAEEEEEAVGIPYEEKIRLVGELLIKKVTTAAQPVRNIFMLLVQVARMNS